MLQLRLQLQLWNNIQPSGNCGMFSSSVLSCPKASVALPKTPSHNDNKDRTAGPTFTSRPTVNADWHVYTYSHDLKSSNPYKVKSQVRLEWIGFAASRANFGICGWEKHQVFRKDIFQCLFSLLPRMHPVVLTDWLLALRKSQTLCSYMFFFHLSFGKWFSRADKMDVFRAVRSKNCLPFWKCWLVQIRGLLHILLLTFPVTFYIDIFS